jgi:phosphoglycolate phosphatase
MKLIIFDFDGVLANTIELSYQIHTVKNKNLTREHFKEYATGNFYEGYDKAVKEGKHIPADDYYGEYKKGLDTLSIHDALHNLILSLARDYRLAIVSSTDSSYINDFIKKENLSECFSDILGSDIHKSKILKIKLILNQYRLSPDDAIYITDTTGDIIEARECGVKSIAVNWGLHDRENLLQENPFALVDTSQELEEKIKEFFK